MAYVYTSIVGMRFRHLSRTFLSTVDISKTKLSREPSNSYDRFAVKCIFNGIHFGYIERTKSEEVFKHLANSNGYRIKLLKSGENFYNISITFERIEAQISKKTPIYSKKTSKPKTTTTQRDASAARKKEPIKSTKKKEKPKPKTTTTQRDASAARKKEPIKSTKKKEKPKYREINNTYEKKPTAQPAQKKSEDTSSTVSIWLFFLILALVYFFLIESPSVEQRTSRIAPATQSQPSEVTSPAVPFLGLPENARLIDRGADWECIPGFTRVNNECQGS